MDISVLRQQLHQYIDIADDRKIEAMYTLLENSSDFKRGYSEAEIKMFYERTEAYLKGNAPGYTVDEAHNYIRKRQDR